METDDDTPKVLPRSAVEKSVNSTFDPLHTAITSPVLAFTPFLTVYLKNAEVKDPVTCVKRLLVPAIDPTTVAESFKVPLNLKVLVTTKLLLLRVFVAKEADVANEELTARLVDTAKEAVVANEELKALSAKLAEVAKLEDNACNA